MIALLLLAAVMGAGAALGVVFWRRRSAATGLTASADKLLLQRAGIVLYRCSTRRGGLDYQGDTVALFGLAPAQLLATPTHWRQSIHPDDAARVAEVVAGLQVGAGFDLEYRIHHADGRWRWLQDRAVGVSGDADEWLIEGLATDITERKVALTTLENERSFLRTLLDTMPDLVFVKDADLRYQLANQAFSEHFDIPHEQIIGSTDADIASPDMLETILLEDRQVLDEGQILFLTAERPNQNGQSNWFELMKVPLRDEAGHITGLLGVGRDITEQRRAEAERRTLLEELVGSRIAQAQSAMALAEDRARQVIQVVTEAIIGIDQAGSITSMNPAAEHLFGYSEAAVLGKNLHELIHHSNPDGSPLSKEQCRITDMVRGAGKINRGVTYWRRDGSSFTAEYSFFALNEADPSAGAVMVIADVTEREARESRLRMLSRAVEESPALVTLTDIQGRIVYVNQRYSEVTGYHSSELIGRTHRVVASGLTPPQVYQELWATISAGQQWQGELQNCRRDGSLFWNRATITPFKDEDGRVTHFLALGEDCTASKQLADSLSTALVAAEAANKAKSEFLANISHEIRTPMNAIIGLTSLAQRSTDQAQAHDYLAKTGRAARDLLALLNDVLDFSKLEADRLSVDPHAFAPETLRDALMNLFADTASRQGISFQVEIDPGVPPVLMGDSLRIRQVLTNLCSNAIKFTVKGGVVVSISTAPLDHAHLRLLLTVSDSGVGIPPEKIDSIFDAFTQADGSTTRRFGGTGLGLTISRQLLHLMGGQIQVESTLGVGSQFRVELPLALADLAPELLTANESVQLARLEGARILVVDDYQLNQEIVVAYLRDAGCVTEVAANGDEALAMLRQQPFDAVLMDCQMPVMDGYEATRRIRANPAWAKLPVIAMTANAMAGDREKCFAAGMSDYLAKPVELDALLELLASRLQRTLEPSAAAALTLSKGPVDSVNSPPVGLSEIGKFSELVGIDINIALKSTMHQPAFLMRILKVFVASQSGFPERFSAALRGDDRELVIREVHTLKGAAASIGAIALRDAALAAEIACKQAASAQQIDPLYADVVAQLNPVLDGIRCCLDGDTAL